MRSFKGKKGVTIINAFQNILDKPNRKPKKYRQKKAVNFIIDQWIKQIRSKNVYKDQLDAIVNKYNSTYHRNIKTKPIDVKPSTYIDRFWYKK